MSRSNVTSMAVTVVFSTRFSPLVGAMAVPAGADGGGGDDVRAGHDQRQRLLVEGPPAKGPPASGRGVA